MTWRLAEKQKQKYHAAAQLGILARLKENGWAGLSAKETGRIGALLRHDKQRE